MQNLSLYNIETHHAPYEGKDMLRGVFFSMSQITLTLLLKLVALFFKTTNQNNDCVLCDCFFFNLFLSVPLKPRKLRRLFSLLHNWMHVIDFQSCLYSLDDRNGQLGWYLGFYMNFFICSESELQREVGGAGFDDGTSKKQHLEMF